jgi:hypothetical protein
MQREKEEEIKRTIDQAKQIEEQRKNEILERQRKQEEKMKMIEQQKQKELELKRKEEEQRESNIKQVIKNNEAIIEQRKNSILNKVQQREENVRRTREKQVNEIKYKRESRSIKHQERREHVERIGQKQNYQREVLNEKIHEKMNRVDQIKYKIYKVLAKQSCSKLGLKSKRKCYSKRSK